MKTLKLQRVIVGMSGGVDSSVSAFLLKQQGYDVEGLFMKNWEEDDTADYCSASIDVADAQAVCDKLGIPLHTVNFAAEYWDHVFEHFLAEYRAGRTPNPDILCNKEIKFKAFLDYACNYLQADAIATGHYAGCTLTDDIAKLCKAADRNKDQTYFLYTLGQSQLKRTLFPLANLTKPEVRALAKEANFPNAKKKDSTGICFIGERRFKEFLQRYLPAQPGVIVTVEGKQIGQHDGLMYHTIGQRQGLKIGGRREGNTQAWYVVAKNLFKNELIVAQGHDHPTLYSEQLICQQLHWVAGVAPAEAFNCQAKTRYRQLEQTCTVSILDTDRFLVEFEQPQWAITPGQSVVFYQDNICLGGGIIIQ